MKIIGIFLMSFVSLFYTEAHADVKFDKSVTIVVSFPPGGESDVIARLFADRLATKIGQNVVVLNKPGASGTIGNSLVTSAEPDGYTLLLSPSTLVTSQLVLSHLVKYDVRQDFTPIVELTKDSILFVSVRSSLNVKNHNELSTKIKSGEVKTYATPGNGSPMNIIGEYYKNQTNSTLKQIAYKGNPPAVRGFLVGEVDILIAGMPTIAPLLAKGEVTVIAAPSSKRSLFLPNVATFAEQGLDEADFSGWQAVFGPAGMDTKMVNALNKYFNEILSEPEIQTKLKKMYTIPAGGSPEDMSKSLLSLYDRFETIIKKNNIKINAQ